MDVLSPNITTDISVSASASSERAPLTIWLPYVLLTTFLLALVAVSFLHFHWRNGHKYRRNADSPSFRQLQHLTSSRIHQTTLVHSSTAEVFARFMASDGDVTTQHHHQQQQQRQRHATAGCHGDGGGGLSRDGQYVSTPPVAFSANSNGSMVDIRSAAAVRHPSPPIGGGSTNRAMTSSTNDVSTGVGGRPAATAAADTSAADVTFTSTNRNSVFKSRRREPSNNGTLGQAMDAGGDIGAIAAAAAAASSAAVTANGGALGSSSSRPSRIASPARGSDADNDVIRIVLRGQQPLQPQQLLLLNDARTAGTLYRRNTDDLLSSSVSSMASYTDGYQQHSRPRPQGQGHGADRLRRNVTSLDIVSSSAPYGDASPSVSGRRGGGARLLPQPPTA